MGDITSRFAGMNVNGIISCAIVCDPFHRRRQPINEFLVEDSNLLRGLIFPVNAYSILILATWTEFGQETVTVK